MASIVKSLGIEGVEGYLVDVEIKTIFGQPMVSIVGLGDMAIKEAKERIVAAINDGGYTFPEMKIVINLAPSDMKKGGSHFDLPMALGILLETGQLKIKRRERYAYIGELSLNAKIRSCNGILPMVIAAKKAGIKNVIVPRTNIKEALLVGEMNIFGFDCIQEMAAFLEGKSEYEPPKEIEAQSSPSPHTVDFKDVRGQDALIAYIVVAAAGGHNLLMLGAPGCGKSMIAKRIPTILPGMTEGEALEVTKIYSVAGMLKRNNGLIQQRPFRAPHHNASTNALIGGGNNATPGEISLAHNGVLFLDEIAEFTKRTLDSLRQPMEDGVVTISRVRYTNSYPASFMLVAAMNPCPCGHYGSSKCKCSDYEILKYRQRISGPLLDRMDIQKYVQPVRFQELSNQAEEGNRSEDLRERVEKARNIQKKRFNGIDSINCNAQMTGNLIKEHCQLDKPGQDLLQKAHDRYEYSARSYHKYLKIARTFADLDGAKTIRETDVAKALMARDLEQENMGLMVL